MTTSRPLILITNDDGIEAPGLRYLVEAVKDLGNVVVVAPEKGMSGMSHAITVREPLRVKKVREQEGLLEYSCTGTPVDAVKLGERLILKRRPDLLLSGINHGSNASVNVVYSGTMAAVIEGCIDGIPSIGYSLLDYSHHADFSACGAWVRRVAGHVLEHGLPHGICLNVNIPALPMEQIRGMKICRQADGAWEETFDVRQDPYDQEYFWLTGRFNERSNGGDTDLVALREGYVSVVPTHYDLTAHHALQRLVALGLPSDGNGLE
ncbi:MAG TPA: 5'/3'-nucleotidase SurE [Bacteroidales bacterium]|nr:5'/3'-nucleotidase SurE [Bacteroidales bacterium]